MPFEPFLRQRRRLTDDELAHIAAIKRQAEALLDMVEAIPGRVTNATPGVIHSAELAKERLAEVVFWATSAMTL